jgi:SAM-dependent methyltransferase
VAKIQLRTEYSAQGSRATPNPRLSVALDYLDEKVERDNSRWTVADHGCGRLRHLETLRSRFDRLVLIDQETQLSKTQMLFGKSTSIRSLAEELNRRDGKSRTTVVSADEFEGTRLDLDLIVCVAVLDVVPPRTRESVLKSTFRNLKTGGLYVLVIPRNDQSITRRGTDDNRYADGHVFYHRGVTTFYKNFRSHEYLATKLRRMGYGLLEDMSIYRHVCLILEKLPGG